MPAKGPTGQAGGVEHDLEPTAADVRETVAWAVTTDHVDFARFSLPGDAVLELADGTYTLDGLDESRAARARRLLSEYATDETLDETGSRPGDTSESASSLTVTVEAPVSEHQSLVESILADVYEVGPDDLWEVVRAKHEAPALSSRVEQATCDVCGDTYEVQFLGEAGFVATEYYRLVDDAGRVGPADSDVDVLHELDRNRWVCAACHDAQSRET